MIMKAYLERNQDKPKQLDYLKILVGEDEFRIQVDNRVNRLQITKISFNDDSIKIYPRVTNQIEVD